MDIETIRTVFSVAAAVLAAVGSGGAIVILLSGWLGRIWAERIMRGRIEKHETDLETLKSKYQTGLESHKVRLKKSEVFFLKELDAASELSAFYHSLLPEYRYPDMSFHDACEELATEFETLEKWAMNFIAKHAAVTPEEIVNQLQLCCSIAGEKKFLISGPDDVPREASEAAEQFWEVLDAASDNFIKHVREQTST